VLRGLRYVGLLFHVGLGLTIFGISMLGNATFSPGYNGVILPSQVDLTSSTTHVDEFYFFMKPTDRLTLTVSSNSSQSIFTLRISDVASNQTILSRQTTGGLSVVYSPADRGVYLLVLRSSRLDGPVVATVGVTVAGSAPSDMSMLSGYLMVLGGSLIFSAFALPYVGSSEIRQFGRKGAKRSLGQMRHPHKFLNLLKWELLTKKSYLVSYLIFFAIVYDGGAYSPKIVELTPTKAATFAISDLLVPSLKPFNNWNVIFPIIVASAAYAFSYERDRLILRSLMLNPIRSSQALLTKVVSLSVVALMPMLIGISSIFALFDPKLTLANPFEVWQNLWVWLVLYSLFEFVMIGFALFPSVVFRKPLYSIVIPLFAYFVASSEGFGIGKLIPPYAWENQGISPLSLGGRLEFNWVAFWANAYPSLIFALVLSILSIVVFQLWEKE